MEKIVYRAIIALSVLGVVIGTAAMYMGFRSSQATDQVFETTLAEGDHRERECQKQATSAAVIAACVSAEDTYTADVLAALNNSRLSANHSFGFGFLAAVVMPIVLFGLFFLLRWIFTGRWRRVRDQAISTIAE